MKNYLLYIITFIIFIACQPVGDDGMDPKLAPLGSKASWWDTNTIYTFEDGPDGPIYGKKHLRKGVNPDTVAVDSVYGTLQVDLARQNITFDVKGWITINGDTVTNELNSTTWHYEVTDDTLLHYESSTTLGTLTKRP